MELTKTNILITDFAGERRAKGKARLVEALQVTVQIFETAFPETEDVEMFLGMSPAFNTVLQQVLEKDLLET